MRTAALALLVLMVCLGSSTAFACRFNVRDVGFVDLETEPYHLFCFVRRGTAPDVVSALTNATATILRDGNAMTEIVNVDDQPSHPALRYHLAVPDGGYPAAVLVSPDGQTLPCALAQPGARFADGIAGNLDRILSSPLRETIVRAVSRSFGVVLLMEGTDADANRSARQTITNAVEEVRQQMRTLPKAIAEAPVLVTLDAGSMERERTLLWSLRLGTEPTSEPRAAVLFGRARWIGPMMKGAELTTRNLVRIFSIIGADCECGLDLAWTQGTRLPVRWGEEIQASVAKALGFDPESPLIKVEVGGILGRRGSATTPNQPRPESSPAPVHSESALASPIPPRKPIPAIPVPPAAGAAVPGLPGSRFVVVVVAAAVTALGVGAWIALRGPRKG